MYIYISNICLEGHSDPVMSLEKIENGTCGNTAFMLDSWHCVFAKRTSRELF